MSDIGGEADIAVKGRNFRFCEGFQMPALRGIVIFSGGRRRKISKGGNRGVRTAAV
jgi:hypothetical protein